MSDMAKGNVMKRIILLIITMIINASFTSCINRTKRYEAEFIQLFDTMTRIIAYTDSKKEFENLSEFIYSSLSEYHRLYDIYNNYDNINNIKTINDMAGKEPVRVDRKIMDLLLFAKDIYNKTNGKCNIAMGPVLAVWHQYREEGIDDPENASLPPMDLLHSYMELADIDKIIVDEKESTVFITDSGMSIDVGAVAKGYAVEQVCKMAGAKGFSSVLISVGGNVKAIGGRNGEDIPWNVGIQDPDLTSDVTNLFITEIINKSVVTSGNYERYYTVDGKNYNHIIDPETLMPAEYFSSVTIIGDDSGLADALSTAVFCMPYEKGIELIQSLPDIEAVWVFADGSIKYSDNFKKYIKNL
jgi:thiamine biosynthesis lipoprotein